MVTRIDFVETGEHIKACQWIQEEEGKLKVLIVPDDGFAERDKKYVEDETLKRVGYGNIDMETNIVTMDKLVYTKRGKFELIVSKLNSKIK